MNIQSIREGRKEGLKERKTKSVKSTLRNWEIGRWRSKRENQVNSGTLRTMRECGNTVEKVKLRRNEWSGRNSEPPMKSAKTAKTAKTAERK